MAQFFRRKWPGVSYGRGEGWHYVGGAGEPAFEDSWANVTAATALAFRIREAGIVDVFGFVDHAGNGNSIPITTLPDGYRPSNGTRVAAVCDTGPCMVIITPLGELIPVSYGGTLGEVWIAAQFFLDPPVEAS